MSNQRNLKAFVRFDGSGRVVAGSLILRRSKPKVGKWQEITAYECCNTILPTTTDFYSVEVGTYPINYPAFLPYCNNVLVPGIALAGTVANLAELIIFLNSNVEFTQYGTYSDGGSGSVKLKMFNTKLVELCPSGTFSFRILAD